MREVLNAPPVAGGATPRACDGLSEHEVEERRARGLGNSVPPPTNRSYRQIIVENSLTFINVVLFGLGGILVILGQYMDALVSIAVILINVLVSIVQEIRAKWILDRITLLAQPRAHVVRQGHERDVLPQDLVAGDVLQVGPGDQIVLDGTVIGDRPEAQTTVMSVDESLLSGESDLVPKRGGDPVYSGSYCVTGSGYYVAEKVGAQSFAQQVTSGARSPRRVLTPLQEQINFVLRLVLLIAIYLEFLLVVYSIVHRIDLVQSVQNATIIAGLVPNGLFLAIALAYAIAAVRILRFGALVQQGNAIESLSHVNVVCLDKTGTLTANQLHVAEVIAFEEDEKTFGDIVGIMVASARERNKTIEAIAAAFPAAAHPITAEVPFSSARKWSAVVFDDDPAVEGLALHGVYALGAPEMIRPALNPSVEWEAIARQVHEWAQQGLRVLLVAHGDNPAGPRLSQERDGDDARLPGGMRPLGLIGLCDELRAEARETVRAFVQMGVRTKIVSGDDPDTVAALARQAGLGGQPLRLVSGSELEALSEASFGEAVEAGTIFGRTTPQQKERLVRALRERGHYVAVIGDGVNDVLALKQANLAIAMHGGSQAARGVSDIVLMQNSFATLVPALREGQRVVNGMQDILKLILTRIASLGLLIVSALALGPFPLALRQGSLATLLAVGIPTVFLALWARPEPMSRSELRRQLLHFVLTAAVVTAAIALLLFYGVIALDQASAASLTPGFVTAKAAAHDALAVTRAQTTVAAFLVFTGLLLVIFVEPPTQWWTGGNRLGGDWRPTVLALALMGTFVTIELVRPLRELFALAPLGLVEWGLAVAATLVWLPLLRWVWRTESIARYLGMTPLGNTRRIA